MKWLQEPATEAEQSLREGLDLAQKRSDELALRRVWSRLSDIDIAPARRLSLRTLGLAAVGGALGAFVLSWALTMTGSEAPAVPAAAPPPLAVAPVSETPPLPVPVPPLVVGPTKVRTGVLERRTVRLSGGANVALAAQTILAVDAGQRPALERGRVRLEVEPQKSGERFTVEAGPYVIVVVGTKFEVGLDEGKLSVGVSEGIVEVWREGRMVHLSAGDLRRFPLLQEKAKRRVRRSRKVAVTSAPVVTPATHPAARFDEAKVALASGDTEGALAILEDLARGSDPTAENSGYELGRILRDHRARPRAAIDAWSRYRERFPRGLLRAETDISIIETMLELGQPDLALTEARAFLRRHRTSERRAEIRELVDQLVRLSPLPSTGAEASLR